MKIFSLKHYVYARVAGFSNKVMMHHEQRREAFDLQNANFEFDYLTGPFSCVSFCWDVCFAPMLRGYCHLKNLIVNHYGCV